MSKTNTPDDARVAALENELRLMREQHTAEMQALRDDLRAARERDGVDRALDALVSRVEDVDADARYRKDKSRLEQAHAQLERNLLKPYEGILDGQDLFAVNIYYPPGEMGLALGHAAQPAPTGGRIIGADSRFAAEAKFKAIVGIGGSDMNGHRTSDFTDGTYLDAHVLLPEEAVKVRANLAPLLDGSEPDVNKLVHAMNKEFQAVHARAANRQGELVS